jgi:simple sugar transport system permease protein/ribose transport system permease protein
MKNISKNIMKKRESLLIVMLLALVILISIVNPVFLRLDNIMDILKNASVLGILTCGMLLVVLTGGIDVSVGAITAACTCVLGMFLKNVLNSIPLVLIVCMISGALLGLINGFFVSRLRIPPIVATLGTYNVIYGFLHYAMNGTWIVGIPESFTIEFGTMTLLGFHIEGVERLIGIPVQVVFLAVAVVFTWWMLKYTRFGRSIYALGGSREAAERCGFNVKMTETMLYAYLGLLAGFAAVVHISIYRNVDPDNFIGYEITVIAATVIGGVSIKGGYGSVLGAMLGVFFMIIMQNGLTLMRISSYWQDIVTGLVIIVMVSVKMYSNYMREKNRFKVDVVDISVLQRVGETSE